MSAIETRRLVIRALRDADVDDLLEYHGDPSVIRYIPWHQRNRQDVEKALAGYKEHAQRFSREGDAVVFGWELKDGGKVIGQSNMSLISEPNKTADLGWVTHPDFWRHGYALEASLAMLAHAFNTLGMHRIVANIDIRNPESARLAEKLGMRREGVFRKAVLTKGEWCDMWLYAVLHEEFSA